MSYVVLEQMFTFVNREKSVKQGSCAGLTAGVNTALS